MVRGCSVFSMGEVRGESLVQFGLAMVCLREIGSSVYTVLLVYRAPPQISLTTYVVHMDVWIREYLMYYRVPGFLAVV